MKKVKVLLPYVIAGALCLCVAIPVRSNSVVLDEAYSVNLVRGSLREIISGAARDVHPPLFYLLLKLAAWLAGGESLVLYRAVTVLATCLNLLVLGATVIRRRWGSRTAVFYLLWFGAAYGTFEYSTLIRMYSWGALWVAAAGLAVVFFYEKEQMRYLALSIVLTLASMYTHYYAVIAVFFSWLLLLLLVLLRKRKMIWHVLTGGILIVLGYWPWLRVWYIQSRRVAGDFWMSDFDWIDWFNAPAQLMESSLKGIGTLLYFLVFVFVIDSFLNKRWKALLFLMVFVGTMVTGALVSVLITPMWSNRYLYVAWGMLSLFMALAAGQIQGPYRWVPQIVLGVVLCCACYFSVKNILADEMITGNADEWVAYLREEVDGDAILIIDDPWEHCTVFYYYLPGAEILMTEDVNVETIRSKLDKAEEKQIWYIADYVQIKYGVEKMESLLNQFGYTLNSVGNYVIKYKNLELFKVEAIKNE